MRTSITSEDQRPTIVAIRAAADRIAPYAHRTPVLTCSALDAMSKASLFFKCENFQRSGSFKFRGATNAVFSLTDEDARQGVVAHSAGNHAQALALAARLRGIPCWIVMPENAPQVKKSAVAAYGAQVTFCKPTLQAREEETEKLIETTGATLIHPYDNYEVIAGQATAALELLEQAPQLDLVIAPVSGGGLLSGTALAVSLLSPGTRTVAAEPSGADDAYRSLQEGKIIPSVNLKTIADGLLTSLGERGFPIIQDHVSAIYTVTDEEILAAMRHVWERMKIVIEPSAAVSLAALLQPEAIGAGRRVGVILSGGNVDFPLPQS